MSSTLAHLIQPGKRVYFLGIGGIGMSALARYLHHAGLVVRGYDRTPTDLTAALTREGIAVSYDITTDWITDTDWIVRTPAVKDHPGHDLAIQQGLPVLKRAELLGAIAATKRTIAIAGTHGKTTTSALTAHLLQAGGLHPTAFVGGIMANYGSNLLLGTGDWLVCEADEFDRSFLHLHPQVAVITSTDADHLDIYGTHEELQNTFAAFAQQVSGSLLLNERQNAWAMSARLSPAATYGLSASANIRAENIRSEGLTMRFDYVSDDVVIDELTLALPGQHNVENTVAAVTIALWAGLTPQDVREGLASFKGVQRRFQVILNTPQLVYVDDYAHHPAEISAVLGSVKKLLPSHKMVVAFQPHLFSRTNDFYREFGASLSIADHVVMAPIYPARELPMSGITSELVMQHITTSKELVQLADVPAALANAATAPSVVLTLGAGDIDTQVAPTRDALLAILPSKPIIA